MSICVCVCARVLPVCDPRVVSLPVSSCCGALFYLANRLRHSRGWEQWSRLIELIDTKTSGKHAQKTSLDMQFGRQRLR